MSFETHEKPNPENAFLSFKQDQILRNTLCLSSKGCERDMVVRGQWASRRRIERGGQCIQCACAPVVRRSRKGRKNSARTFCSCSKYQRFFSIYGTRSQLSKNCRHNLSRRKSIFGFWDREKQPCLEDLRLGVNFYYVSGIRHLIFFKRGDYFVGTCCIWIFIYLYYFIN